VRSLSETSHEHHEAIVVYVDLLPPLADMIGGDDPDALRDGFDQAYRFIVRRLVPHMEAIETTLYGRLDALMGKRHSMAPMRREHAELRRLIEQLGHYHELLDRGPLETADGIGLRRALYRLHGIMKVHLAEEELYLRVLDHNLSDEEKDVLARGIDHACAEPL
jgi:hemerythrin-like domain-containing protein